MPMTQQPSVYVDSICSRFVTNASSNTSDSIVQQSKLLTIHFFLPHYLKCQCGRKRIQQIDSIIYVHNFVGIQRYILFSCFPPLPLLPAAMEQARDSPTCDSGRDFPGSCNRRTETMTGEIVFTSCSNGVTLLTKWHYRLHPISTTMMLTPKIRENWITLLALINRLEPAFSTTLSPLLQTTCVKLMIETLC